MCHWPHSQAMTWERGQWHTQRQAKLNQLHISTTTDRSFLCQWACHSWWHVGWQGSPGPWRPRLLPQEHPFSLHGTLGSPTDAPPGLCMSVCVCVGKRGDHFWHFRWARTCHTPYVPRPPWMLTASTPFSNRYSWISSTSAFFSENTNTWIIGIVVEMAHSSSQILASQLHKWLTGGGVFCRHSRR